MYIYIVISCHMQNGKESIRGKNNSYDIDFEAVENERSENKMFRA